MLSNCLNGLNVSKEKRQCVFSVNRDFGSDDGKDQRMNTQ